MQIHYDAIHTEARRLRTEAINRLVFAPIAAFFHRLAQPEPRRPAAVFPTARSC